MEYKILQKQVFEHGKFQIVPIRFEDRHKIRQWRNEQIYHLRQSSTLSEEDQDNYFNNVILNLFEQEKPSQILFTFLVDGKCIGYGGLVHINWIDLHSEISFLMDTKQEQEHFEEYWCEFLRLIEQVAFTELSLHKIYTYAFDIRPKLYLALEKSGFNHEATLKEHCLFEEKYINVIIHSKFNSKIG